MNNLKRASKICAEVCVVGFLLLSVSAQSVAKVPPDIYKMSEQVVYLKKVGNWMKGTLNGGFQVIVEREGNMKGSHHLYVRWVCHCLQTKVSIISILEQNGDEAYVMTQPWYEYKEETSLLNYYRKNIHTDLWQQVQVQLTDIGEYKFVMRSVKLPEAPVLPIR